jgi:hypothetical protein
VTTENGGRPAHAPDERSRRLVEMLSMLNFRQETIAGVIGCDGKTLRKHYRKELDVSYAELGAQLMSVGVRRALGAFGGPKPGEEKPDPEKVDTSLWKFIMERRFGMVPPVTRLQHGGAVGSFDLSSLSDEDLDRLESIHAKLAASAGDPGGEGTPPEGAAED